MSNLGYKLRILWGYLTVYGWHQHEWGKSHGNGLRLCKYVGCSAYTRQLPTTNQHKGSK